MSVQLPYNPNPQPAGMAPIPVWVPPPNGNFSNNFTAQSYARVIWTPTRRQPPIIIPSTNTTFPLFPRLPPELRARIWSFTAPCNRVLEIRSWGSGRYAPIRFSIHPHRLPIIFSVCKESRAEARRIYKLVEVGVSAAVKRDDRMYVPWKYHPTNPAAENGLTVGTAPLAYAEPYPPAKVRVNWNRDIIYLGPEFKREHLLQFLTTVGAGQELCGVQRLALCHKLWVASEDGTWDILRNCLWILKSRRDVREVIIVPDDERGALIDRWYYGKHNITMVEPEWTYKFRPNNGDIAKNFVHNLEEWFARLWKDAKSPTSSSCNIYPLNSSQSQEIEDDAASVGTLTDEVFEVGTQPPDVSIKCIRRNGRRMADFKEGLWEIQEAIGDMRVWNTWLPPSSLEA